MAYVLLCARRRVALKHTQFADATCGTIRLELLKIGALERTSVRLIKIAMASCNASRRQSAIGLPAFWCADFLAATNPRQPPRGEKHCGGLQALLPRQLSDPEY